MEENNANSSAITNPEEEPEVKKVRVFSDKLGIKDEHAGEKIKYIADDAGFIGAILMLFFGFLIWYKADNLAGFLIGLVVAGAGIYASYILVSMLYSYGDMVTMSIEQMKILKQLEAKKTEELALASALEIKEQWEKEQSAAVSAADDAVGQEPHTADDVSQQELTDPQGEIAGVKTKVVTVAMVDKMNRIAHFDGRPDLEIKCPLCNRKQSSESHMCFYCGCKFIFDDEQPGNNVHDLRDQTPSSVGVKGE